MTTVKSTIMLCFYILAIQCEFEVFNANCEKMPQFEADFPQIYDNFVKKTTESKKDKYNFQNFDGNGFLTVKGDPVSMEIFSTQASLPDGFATDRKVNIRFVPFKSGENSIAQWEAEVKAMNAYWVKKTSKLRTGFARCYYEQIPGGEQQAGARLFVLYEPMIGNAIGGLFISPITKKIKAIVDTFRNLPAINRALFYKSILKQLSEAEATLGDKTFGIISTHQLYMTQNYLYSGISIAPVAAYDEGEPLRYDCTKNFDQFLAYSDIETLSASPIVASKANSIYSLGWAMVELEFIMGCIVRFRPYSLARISDYHRNVLASMESNRSPWTPTRKKSKSSSTS